ncbi:hypothetical protein CAPTEDRAFT_213150 [Capitella teleta]|uniref:G-protein coupled receptors family 1 profile domain-containing protein n=1 Tax=Capitella teleta TaxID=283909 RepID=R7TUD6_CAPTE|nr:hypothetical protein CAPTEDRAFT_213150 [Capitella teleta]|eukprot:ELT97523.1 hypothetical protein CAPTEDRAFT_213150 [Capitella teleta]
MNASDIFPIGNSNESVRPRGDPDYERHIEDLQGQLAIIRFIVQRLLTPVIVTFGVFGNLVNIVVLTRRWMNSSTNCYLTALAVCDILYLAFAMSMSFAHYPSIKNIPSFIRFKSPFGRPLVDTFSNTSVWLTLTFTIERYIGVCHPMKGMRWCTPQRARYVIALVCVAAAIVTFPEFFECMAISVTNSDNVTTLTIVPTKFGGRPSYSFGYYFINQGLFTLVPFALLLIFNTLLIKAVLTAARQRRAMAKVVVVKCTGTGRPGGSGMPHRQQSDQQKITIMLIVVVIVFLICQLPQAIQKLYNSYLMITVGPVNLSKVTVLQLKISGNILNLLVMVNAASNFVLYSSFSTKFRRTFRRIFCHCLPGHRRSIPEILFTDMTSMNPSPPEETRTHLLRTKYHQGQYSHHWDPHIAQHGRGNRSARTAPRCSSPNGYLGVKSTPSAKDCGRDGQHNSSAL